MAGEGKLDSPGTYSTENGVFCSGGVRFIALEDTTTANQIIKVMVV
jgi:hypothetical protein